jgi:hypothetical protein
MDVERTMQFILDCQARTEATLQRMSEREERMDLRMEKMDAYMHRAVRLAVQEVRAERRRRREMDARWDEKMTQLAAGQLLTEEKLQALSGTVDGLSKTVDGLSKKIDGFLDGLRPGGNGHPAS